MADRIEPPILLSRLMTFVFASSLVVLGVLGLTLYNMFPLKRPQVFFLFTRPNSTQTISLAEMNSIPNKEDRFIRAFLMEYIKARNEIVPNVASMHMKWNNNSGGIVRAWSTDEVFENFINTDMYAIMMSENPDFEVECPVEFKLPIKNPTNDTYDIEFRYFCRDLQNSDRQPDVKSYTVRIKLDKGYKNQPSREKWTDRLANPLGVRVADYKILSGNGDPLNIFGQQE